VVTEAIGKGQDPTKVKVLSIGTAMVRLLRPQPGQRPSPFVQPILKPRIAPDVRKVATAIIDDPPDVATFLAHIMTGSGKGVKRPADSRIIRMNPLISPVKKGETWSAPDCMTPADFGYLTNLDLDAVQRRQVDAISNYAGLWVKDVAPNQPIRMKGETIELEVGKGLFSEAVAAWKVLAGRAPAWK
jgi:hypothetical protein